MNRSEWLKERKKGIGASDAPIIMGVSPYSTPYQLWLEKISPDVAEEKNTFILEKGLRLEPMALALIEFELGKSFQTQYMAALEDVPWLRATLDGYSECGEIIEIKYMGAEPHRPGNVPEQYFPQLQHQMLVTGKPFVWFCSFNPDAEKKLHITKVERDDTYIKDYLEKAKDFWQKVLDRRPPDLTPKDSKKIRDSHLIALANEYAENDATLEKLETRQEEIKKLLLEDDKIKSHANVECGRVKILQIQRTGNVNYKAVPELKGVDLEKYRAKPVIYSKISII